MILEPWFVQHAVELADQTLTQLGVAASAVHHDVHVLLEEITDPSGWMKAAGGINGGCHLDLL